MAEIKEACGVFGMYGPEGENVAPSLYYGLTALQHRGQEACGMAVSRTDKERGNVCFHKDLGLVSEVLTKDVLEKMDGNIGLAIPLRGRPSRRTRSRLYCPTSRGRSLWHTTAI